ncbi:hypothetical protein BH09BAC2_BH09BAC2_09770 [soil metagenome]
MKNNILKIMRPTLTALAAVFVMSACNKKIEDIPVIIPAQSTAKAIADTLSKIPTDSLFYRVITKSGLAATLNNKANSFTLFVPDNTAFINSLPIPTLAFATGYINSLSATNAASLVNYNIVPQKFTSADIPTTFPNLQLPTGLIVDPTNPLARMTTAVSRRTTYAYDNNIPLTAVDLIAGNGVIHHTAAIVAPPSKFLWDRINTDADLSIFKAAIQRADSGGVAGATLQATLAKFGPNFTVFAPNNQALANLISALTGGAIPPTAPAAIFIGFLGSNNLTTQMVQGIVVYHIFDGQAGRPGRAFLVNFPTTPTTYKTLLNSSPIAAAHPGVTISATFGGPLVTTATVKGLANATASNILINPTPGTGSSDQHYINGVLHKIDQVLIPQ